MSNDTNPIARNDTARRFDEAAIETFEAVKAAVRVRKMTGSAAIAFVAERTEMPVEVIQAFIDRAGQIRNAR